MQDVIIFGKGRYYTSKLEAITQRYHIIAFLDNIVKPGETLLDNDGIVIYNPRDVIMLPKVPIITMSAKFFEMWEQLISLGIEDKRIMFGVELQPYYDKIEKMLNEKNIKLYSKNSCLFLKCEKKEYKFFCEEEYKIVIRSLQEQYDTDIQIIKDLPLEPISRRCGYERGTPIDRYYIEKFICLKQKYIQGKVMEVADDQYIKKFGCNVDITYVMHVEGWGKDVIQVNLETGEGVLDNSIDCFICTQTIQMIYNIKAAIHNIYRMLKPGGTALVTIGGIAGLSLYDYYRWGEYWRVTPKALKKIFEEEFGEDLIEIFSYGNIKTTTAFLYGICVEDLEEEDFIYNDEQFPLLIGCLAKK